MATETVAVLVADLTGDPADTTVKFALNKTEYEIDLSNDKRWPVARGTLALRRRRPQDLSGCWPPWR